MGAVTTTNTTELSTDINVIIAEINSYKQVAGNAIYEIGRRLKHVRDVIFKDIERKQSGEWRRFLRDIDMDLTTVKRMIQAYEQFGEGGATSHLPTGKIFEMLSLPAEIDRSDFVSTPHTIPSTGETKTVDEMTVRELREVKAALKAEREAREKAERDYEAVRDTLALPYPIFGAKSYQTRAELTMQYEPKYAVIRAYIYDR